jgi:hypothetical protein
MLLIFKRMGRLLICKEIPNERLLSIALTFIGVRGWLSGWSKLCDGMIGSVRED